MSVVSHEQVRDYLGHYVVHYRAAYEQLTVDPPAGAGYPALAISPYVGRGKLRCYVATDGTVTLQEDHPAPPYEWWIAGGPALMVDLPDTQTPNWVRAKLEQAGLAGQPIGIYRLVSKSAVSEVIWVGKLDDSWPKAIATIDSLQVEAIGTPLSLVELLQRLTFGAFGLILDIHLGTPASPFWAPHVVRDLGFMTADRANRRFFNYMEIGVHLDAAAWDERSIPTRLYKDIRRDFGQQFAKPGPGGTLSYGSANYWVQPFIDRLTALGSTIDRFEQLLKSSLVANEAVFQTFLENNSILLDVYGAVEAKPRLPYPAGEGALGKAYVEPDFIIRYPERRYKLVELERPSKRLATDAGHPRVDVTQSTFQVAEWRAHIANHYDLIRERFPGINLSNSAMIVISRTGVDSVGRNRDVGSYRELLRAQYPTVDIITYDDLLNRAKDAYAKLSALDPGR